MTGALNKMISDFTDKPATDSFFTAIVEYTASLGPVTKEVKAQVSFSVNRKNRWNHHVEVKSEAIANSGWLQDLIRQGYEFASK